MKTVTIYTAQEVTVFDAIVKWAAAYREANEPFRPSLEWAVVIGGVTFVLVGHNSTHEFFLGLYNDHTLKYSRERAGDQIFDEDIREIENLAGEYLGHH